MYVWRPLGESPRERVSLCISPLGLFVHSILSDRIQSHTITHCVKSEITKTAPSIISAALILITLMHSFMQRSVHDVLAKISRWRPHARILLHYHIWGWSGCHVWNSNTEPASGKSVYCKLCRVCRGVPCVFSLSFSLSQVFCQEVMSHIQRVSSTHLLNL